MGLFSFIKDAGAKIFGKKKPEAPAVENTVESAPMLTQEELDSQKADELIALIQNLGLEIHSLYVAVEGDLVTIAGSAATQSEKEKAILAVGNVSGVAQVDDQIRVDSPEPEPEPEAIFHTVVSGDSLSKIAGKYYGDVMKYPVIFEANKPMLTDPDKIYPGQVLRIPSQG